jgi:hypothetical protein
MIVGRDKQEAILVGTGQSSVTVRTPSQWNIFPRILISFALTEITRGRDGNLFYCFFKSKFYSTTVLLVSLAVGARETVAKS